MKRPFGLAHLSALHLSPPELVDAAAVAGFPSVGIRVVPAAPGEMRFPMEPGSPMSLLTQRKLADTGISVRDIEAFTLDSSKGRKDWMPALEAGAALGASVLNVICAEDPYSEQLISTLTVLVGDAAEYGIRASIEPISYQPLSSTRAAADLSTQTGCGVMIDTLHFVRAGNAVGDLALLPKDSVTVIQICDGPIIPSEMQPSLMMPLGQDVPSDQLRFESRARRSIPGEGTFPLQEICSALPSRTSISVEVPNVPGVPPTGVSEYLRNLFTATENLLGEVAN